MSLFSWFASMLILKRLCSCFTNLLGFSSNLFLMIFLAKITLLVHCSLCCAIKFSWVNYIFIACLFLSLQYSIFQLHVLFTSPLLYLTCTKKNIFSLILFLSYSMFFFLLFTILTKINLILQTVIFGHFSKNKSLKFCQFEIFNFVPDQRRGGEVEGLEAGVGRRIGERKRKWKWSSCIRESNSQNCEGNERLSAGAG